MRSANKWSGQNAEIPRNWPDPVSTTLISSTLRFVWGGECLLEMMMVFYFPNKQLRKQWKDQGMALKSCTMADNAREMSEIPFDAAEKEYTTWWNKRMFHLRWLQARAYVADSIFYFSRPIFSVSHAHRGTRATERENSPHSFECIRMARECLWLECPLHTHTHTSFFCNFLSPANHIAFSIVCCLKFDLKSFSNNEYRNVLCAAWTGDVFTQLNFLVLFDCCTDRTQTRSAETAQNLKLNFKINFRMDFIVLQSNICP